MIAFVGVAAAEAATGKSVLEQAAAAPFSVFTVAFLISIASIFPKYASGVPLARLIDGAGEAHWAWWLLCCLDVCWREGSICFMAATSGEVM